MKNENWFSFNFFFLPILLWLVFLTVNFIITFHRLFVFFKGESDAKFWYNWNYGILVCDWVLCIIRRSGRIFVYEMQFFNVIGRCTCKSIADYSRANLINEKKSIFDLFMCIRLQWISHICIKMIQIKMFYMVT